MEEKSKDKQIQFTIQEYLDSVNIQSILRQVIQLQKYSINNLQKRCFKKEIIYKIIMYLLYRESNNSGNVVSHDRALLQFEIKRWFIFLPKQSKKFQQFCISSNYFLIELLILSQISYKIIQSLSLNLLNEISPQIIFIIIVFLSTDKLVSPYCYPILHEKLLHKKQNSLTKYTIQPFPPLPTQNKDLKSFKQELRKTLYISQTKAEPIKKTHSVSIMRNNYTNKSNTDHYQLFKQLKQDSLYKIQPIQRQKRTYSHANFNNDKRESTNSQTKWSKCELTYAKYIPFSNIEMNIRRPSSKQIIEKQKWMMNKKKTSILLQKRNLLKI